MQITWYGHSAFRLDFAGRSVLVDPFFTGNPAFDGNKDEAIEGVSHILITHGHGDHIGDAVDIAGKTGATVFTNYDLCMYLAAQGLKNFSPMNTGGTVDAGGFRVTLVRADHSAGLVEVGVNFPLGSANGIIVRADGEPTIYAMGDTDLFSDMALINDLYKPDVAFVPIGDRFTMGAESAAYAVKKFLTVKTVVPCHYGTFPIIDPDAGKFTAAMQGAGSKVFVAQKNKAFAP
ncbi:metal-dependent hydrolase [Chelatococcus reniformis]|uniref:UPF0173 metal-dependent hydrolase GCM10010994_15190 n=1 Tax=Chelatococcus reniformis TaxID=1494448 RepID=A0A916U3E9_9HYPH|nr:metal-dependent hydrolase [Chelatococcus reniformis]GGC57208.1 UPF0173 metal-dependent hydrolase [Chelatococcus reniformis]